MPKFRLNLNFKIKHFFTNHPWLKFISLCLAVIVWSYVSGQISRLK